MESYLKQHWSILNIGVAVLLMVIMGVGACAYFAIHPVANTSLSYWALSLSLTAVAVITFFGFMWYMQSLGGQWALNKGGMRLAIVASVMTVYLVLVGTVMFFTNGDAVPPMTQTLLTHFTSVVLTVVAFYFGTSAYVQVHEGRDRPVAEEPKK